MIRGARHDAQCSCFRAEADFSNVAYYPQPGQRESHAHNTKRLRRVLYVRGGAGRSDYFVFADDDRPP